MSPSKLTSLIIALAFATLAQAQAQSRPTTLPADMNSPIYWLRLAALEEAKSKEQNIFGRIRLSELFAKAGEKAVARERFTKIARELNADKPTKDTARELSSLVEGMHDFDRAEAMKIAENIFKLRESLNDNDRDEVLSDLGYSLAECNEYDQASRAINLMIDAGIRFHAAVNAAKVLSTDSPRQAVALLDLFERDMKAAGSEKSDGFLDAFATNRAFNIYCECGQIDKAKDIIPLIKVPHWRVAACANLSRQYRKSNDAKSADMFLKQAMDTAELAEESHKDVVQGEIALALLEAGREKEATAILERLPREDRLSIRTNYLTARCEGGDAKTLVQAAENLLAELGKNVTDDQYTPDWIVDCGKVLAQAGQLDRALKLMAGTKLPIMGMGGMASDSAGASEVKAINAWLKTLKDTDERYYVCAGAAEGLMRRQENLKKIKATSRPARESTTQKTTP